MKLLKQHYAPIIDRLTAARLRPTRQRVLLGSLLWKEANACRHVSAEMLHNEAKHAGIQVSLATVYNTLHQFTEAGLLREVSVDGSKSYFDTNLGAHHHYFYEDSGEIEDICGSKINVGEIPVPAYGEIAGVEVIVRVKGARPAM